MIINVIMYKHINLDMEWYVHTEPYVNDIHYTNHPQGHLTHDTEKAMAMSPVCRTSMRSKGPFLASSRVRLWIMSVISKATWFIDAYRCL